MHNEIRYLMYRFYQIRELGWIKSIRKGNSGIGRTFESLLGTEENINQLPDYHGIEIKTKRHYSKSYTTLFNCKPDGPTKNEVIRLRDRYGYPDSVLKQYKVFNNCVFGNEWTLIANKYLFKLIVDRSEQKIFLYIFDRYGELIDNRTYWNFNTLKEKLYKKGKVIAFVKALRKFIDKDEYFKYYYMTIYTLKDFNTFINLIESGVIRITFKIGVYRSGEKLGLPYEHGTGFDIKESDLIKLYNIYDFHKKHVIDEY